MPAAHRQIFAGCTRSQVHPFPGCHHQELVKRALGRPCPWDFSPHSALVISFLILLIALVISYLFLLNALVISHLFLLNALIISYFLSSLHSSYLISFSSLPSSYLISFSSLPSSYPLSFSPFRSRHLSPHFVLVISLTISVSSSFSSSLSRHFSSFRSPHLFSSFNQSFLSKQIKINIGNLLFLIFKHSLYGRSLCSSYLNGLFVWDHLDCWLC
jgi:hypothetical protein